MYDLQGSIVFLSILFHHYKTQQILKCCIFLVLYTGTGPFVLQIETYQLLKTNGEGSQYAMFFTQDFVTCS